MRIAFSTFGCKINQFETDGMRETVASRGDVIVPFEERADVYVINTCSVTAKSDYQCRQAIRAAARRNNGARVLVTGCYAETHREEVLQIPGVHGIVPNSEKENIARYVDDGDVSTDGPAVQVSRSEASRTRSFLKIQDGCDGGCSYCIVPLARGASRSTARSDVLRSFDDAVARGAPEVVLSGIHIGRYGADLSPSFSLTDLIAELLLRRRSARIRLSSIEPNEVTPEIVSFLGRGLCRHLHIPLQSGSDRILRAMNRQYDSRFYRELVQDISKRVPDVGIGADVMVGFPGEGDDDFRKTYALIEDMPLSHLHVFSYSTRPGTAAAMLPLQVSGKVKKERSELLRMLGAEKNVAFRKRFIGQTLPVVVESKLDGTGLHFLGTSDNYIRMSVAGALDEDVGREIPVKISIVDGKGTTGHVVGN